MAKRGVLLIAVLIALLSFPSIEAATATCADDGSFFIEKSSKKVPVYAQTNAGELVEVAGEWILVGDSKIKVLRKFNFQSDEGIFISKEPAKQKIKVGKKTYTLSCPAFKFSCRIFNLSIDYCYTINETFHAKYSVYNFDIDEKDTLRFEKPFVFRYDLLLPDRKSLTHAPTILSQEFAELNITMRKLADLNKFILESKIGRAEVQSLEIRYEECHQRKFNLFEKKQCTEQSACTIAKDCGDDEQCTEGFCQKIVCGDCQYSANNTCHDYECCDSSACVEDASCQENGCVKLECAGTQKIQEHACVALICAEDEYLDERGCRKLLCAEEEVPQDHACVPLQCGFFQKIKDHQCVGWIEWITGEVGL